jgi:hypothetical protein
MESVDHDQINRTSDRQQGHDHVIWLECTMITLLWSLFIMIKYIGNYMDNDHFNLVWNSVVDPNSFFSDSDPQIFFRIRIRFRILTGILMVWPRIFENGASHCFCMCSGICTKEKKVFQMTNLRFLKCLICDFFTTFFYFTAVSGSESELFFAFGSSQNVRIISDSDLEQQHWFESLYHIVVQKKFDNHDHRKNVAKSVLNAVNLATTIQKLSNRRWIDTLWTSMKL